MAKFLLKVKSKNGQSVLTAVNGSSTIKDLKNELSKLIDINVSNLHVLFGYPPKPLNLTNDDDTLESVDIRSGDTLIVDEKIKLMDKDEKEETKSSSIASKYRHHTQEQTTDSHGILMKKVVPADNSCLFTSVGFVLSGRVDVTCGTYMREIIASSVASDQETYNAAILGRPVHDYCAWIQRPDSWGGAIELAILSKFYGMEIAVIDTVNAIINRFGEDQNHDHRVFLVFDGIHYDPVYLQSFQGDGPIQTMFPAIDESFLREAEVLAMEARNSHQFTNVYKFTLKCLVCNTMLTGQKEAMAHCKETGHNNFGEVKS